MPELHAPHDLTLMRAIERAAARNLRDYVAVYRQLAPGSGATCIDVAGGVAAFTGVDSPLTTVKGTGPYLSLRDLERIESFLGDHGVTGVTIEAAPWLVEESREILIGRGYRVGPRETVVTAPRPTHAALVGHAEAVTLQEWPELMRRSYELPDETPVEQLVAASAHLPTAELYGVREDDRWIGCAQSARYDDVVIFSNDGTHPEARGRGVHAALIMERLRALPLGAIATAEVAPGGGSERNYLRCGFRIAYARSHYVGVSR